jgi:hypothetical protein
MSDDPRPTEAEAREALSGEWLHELHTSDAVVTRVANVLRDLSCFKEDTNVRL